MMGKYLSGVICIISLGIFITGCDDSSSSKDNIQDSYISFSVDGENYRLTSGPDADMDEDSIYLYAYDKSSDRYIEMYVYGVDTGTYQNQDETDMINIYYGPDEDHEYQDAVGSSVTITKTGELGETIEGTFEANMVCSNCYETEGPETLVITDGEFVIVRNVTEEDVD